MKRYPFLVACLALVLLSACVAPLSRTTELRKGLAFEVGGGLSEYRGHGLTRDSGHWLGYRPMLRDIRSFGARSEASGLSELRETLRALITASQPSIAPAIAPVS